MIKKTVASKKKKVVTRKKPKLTAWEVALSVINPSNHRPRRTSIHTLAAVIGHKNPLALAKQMEKSDKVSIYHCPDIDSPICYLKSLKGLMIDTHDNRTWKRLPAFFKKHPYPEVKGFKRFALATWTGGSWGRGKYVKGVSAMNVPYEVSDYPYANKIISALKNAGYKPGIEKLAATPYQLGM